MIIWMEYKGMNKYLCKSTTRFRKYNKINTNGVEMVMKLMDMMIEPLVIFVAARTDARMRVPPPNPFGR